MDEILAIPGIDEIHVGLNDLSIGYGLKFLFEPLANGTIDMLAEKIRREEIPFGFGGIASLGKGMLPSEYVIMEHYRLGSGCVILSRSFCNIAEIEDLDQVRRIFDEGIRSIRAFEMECRQREAEWEKNRVRVAGIVQEISGRVRV